MRGKRSLTAAAFLAVLMLCLSSCDVFQQANLAEFVETGLTMVSIRSASFDAGSGSLATLPSGMTLTGSIVLVNPKAFDVSYTLGLADDSLFTVRPSTSPSPTDATHLSFSFALDPRQAEHKTVVFSLGKYVASINKTYDLETVSLLCDSPPNCASRVATLMDSGEKSVLAVLLPTETSDDDLAKLKISWNQEGSTVTSTETYAISSLATAPAANPFSSTYDCYFQSSDCVAGYGYAYSVVVLDSAGQESGAVATSSTANVFYLNYDGNGNTSGTAPASVGYRFGATATVASIGDLAKAAYVFHSWNTAADGSGMSYSPGATLSVPAGETVLYAQWYTNSSSVTFDIGTQALVFAPSVMTLSQGSTLTATTTNGTLAALTGWTWYIDGSSVAGQKSSTLGYDTSALAVGSHTISAVVTDSATGLSYSGHFKLTVTN